MKKPKRKTGTAVVVHRPRSPAGPPPGASPIQMIVWAARNKSVDVAKMAQLLALRKEMEAEEAARQFSVAMREARARIPVVVKDARNPDTKSHYAKLETVSRVVDPIAKACGFWTSYTMADSPLPAHYRIMLRLGHEGGHVVESFLDLPADDVGLKGNPNKTKVHGAASSVTYARRILKVIAFDVNVADNALPDDDANLASAVSGAVSPAVAQQVANACDDAGLDKRRFCEAMGIDGIATLPAKRAREALDRIEEFKRAKGKAA